MSIINSCVKIVLRTSSLPLAILKDVTDELPLKEYLPATANIVNDIFNDIENIFMSCEDVIDNYLRE